MVTGVWGHKIGMTQVFSNNKVIPVTVIAVGNWFVTGLKLQDRDGYEAVQVGCVRKRYEGKSFSADWLKKPSLYFRYLREIKANSADYVIGQVVNFYQDFKQDQLVDVVGWSKGCGFAGVYKRHGFGGAAKSHGSMMGRRPGSIGGLRTSGRVIKGKRMAGHLGNQRTVVKHLNVVSINENEKAIIVKGCVPGKTGSLVFIRKA